jgi:hypothetical protein
MPARPATKKTETKNEEITVVPLEYNDVVYHILGTSPFIFNAVPQKTWRELLFPRGPMTRGTKASSLKHDPVQEFRDSTYQDPLDDGPTRLIFPAGAFKKAIASAALDMKSNSNKAQLGRLASVPEQWAPFWGTPRLFMAVVRNKDQNRTPDIRTRARLEQWATKVTVRYVTPVLNHDTISTLFAAAGIIIGVGDGRQEKGTFSFGGFEIVAPDDPRYLAVLKEGRVVQDAALANPECADANSAEMLEWFAEEFARRRDQKGTKVGRAPRAVVAASGNGKANGKRGNGRRKDVHA